MIIEDMIPLSGAKPRSGRSARIVSLVPKYLNLSYEKIKFSPYGSSGINQVLFTQPVAYIPLIYPAVKLFK